MLTRAVHISYTHNSEKEEAIDHNNRRHHNHSGIGERQTRDQTHHIQFLGQKDRVGNLHYEDLDTGAQKAMVTKTARAFNVLMIMDGTLYPCNP